MTVLLKPSSPRISPSSPIATEGRPTNLTCSSTGGSPPPQVFGKDNDKDKDNKDKDPYHIKQVRWYREGEAQLLDSVMVLGATKDEPTSSVLTLVPQRTTDGAVYRWEGQ